MNQWETYSPFQFNAYSRTPALAWVLQVSQCFPHRFAEYSAARDAVEHMAFAEENWDGCGAVPINFQTKVTAKVALAQLEAAVPAPQVTPNSNGTLSFEWETDRGAAHLEIGRTRYSFYVKPVVGVAYFARGHVNQIDATLGLRVNEGLFPKPSSTVSHPAI
jgi:hypothetical protein